jgi:dolichyl-phosphate-mannose-protein mannosyltransferase
MTPRLSRVCVGLIAVLGLITALAAAWPVYRAFLRIEIDDNEGWNAYYADAAMGGAPLYPSRDRLITNNYPPLSFYLAGAIGRCVGDPVLAGRLVSLVSLAVVAWGVAAVVRHFGGGRTAAACGALYYTATMCRFFTQYVGMNDPHLLGQAVMTVGFVLLLRAVEQDRGIWLPVVLMVAAGFIKHTLIVLPLVGFVWLGIHRPRRLLPAGLVAAGALAAGFALCHAAYGADFYSNMMAPRAMRWQHAVGAVGHLQWTALGLLVWGYLAATRSGDPGVRLCNLLVGFALPIFFFQKMGDGVAHNAQFDLVWAVSIAVGVALAQAPLLPLAQRYSPDRLWCVLLLAVCVRLAASSRVEPVALLFDRGFHAEIAEREAAMERTVCRIRATPGDTLSSPLACFWAGKPFVVDMFNVRQRIAVGQLPPDVVDRLVASGRVSYVVEAPALRWGTKIETSRHVVKEKVAHVE